MKKIALPLLFFISTLLLAKEPSALYLTYQHDPTTTMTVLWHTDEDSPTQLTYQKDKGDTWTEAKGKTHKIKDVSLYVHTVELSKLQPNTRYTFRVDSEKTPHHFRTLPSTLSRPVRFAVGGDAYYYLHLFRKMNLMIAKKKPDFVVVGGDIAYTRGRHSYFQGSNWKVRRWQTFFREYTRDMITPEGNIIPMLLVVGNHDVRKKGIKHLKENLLFQFYPFPEETTTYTTLSLGNYAALFLLDTGHAHPIAGKQTAWLSAALKSNQEPPFKFALYHVAAYPSYYSFNSSSAKQVREHWVPLFEAHHITAAFEHHNHTFKRTHPLLQDKPHPDGIPYLGDGSWGVPARIPRPPKVSPYLATSGSINAVWLVRLEKDAPALFEAIDINGKTFDSLTIPTKKP